MTTGSGGDAEEAQRAAAEIVVRCVRRIGELAPPKAEPRETGRGKKLSLDVTVSRQELERARALAALPEKIFEQRLAEAREEKRGP